MSIFPNRRFPRLALVGLFLFLAAIARAEPWEATVTPLLPGSQPEPRALRARYNFGWSGITAATIATRFEKLGDGRFQLAATGGTAGLARALWKYDLRHHALADATTLRPVLVREVEKFRNKEVTTEVTFSPGKVASKRDEQKEGALKTTARNFDFPNAQSVLSALLILRSQPLADGAVLRVVVYPATSSYLCTVTVVGRERLQVPTGRYDAIKLDVKLSKINEQRQLVPHKKFQNATVWLSNDADRLVLRIEAQVFVGTVFAEIQSLQFDNPKP